MEKEELPGIWSHTVSELTLAFGELSGDLGSFFSSTHPFFGALRPLSVKWEGHSAHFQGPSNSDMTSFVALHPLALLRDSWETLERCHLHTVVPSAMHGQLDARGPSRVDLGCFPKERNRQWWLESLGRHRALPSGVLGLVLCLKEA